MALPRRPTGICFIFYFLCSLAPTKAPAHDTLQLLCEEKLLLPPQTFQEFIQYPQPIIMIHGKNENIGSESTWPLWSTALRQVPSGPVGLEIDVRLTRDGVPFILHNPTFHVTAGWRATPEYKIHQFFTLHPELQGVRHRGNEDFWLFDGVHTYTWQEIRHENFVIGDKLPAEKAYFPVLLEELLAADTRPGSFNIPAYLYWDHLTARYEQSSAESIPVQGRVLLFLDFKPVNNLARRLYGLHDREWIYSKESTHQLANRALLALQSLDQVLAREQAYDYAFIPARHPEIARLAKLVNPKIHYMLCPEKLTWHEGNGGFDPKDVIAAFEEFGPRPGDMIEIRYLAHVLDPRIRRWARERQLKILFDEIDNTDGWQFGGRYAGNDFLRYQDILALGEDVIIQTNTPNKLHYFLYGRKN
jgi:hypothetical protein